MPRRGDRPWCRPSAGRLERASVRVLSEGPGKTLTDRDVRLFELLESAAAWPPGERGERAEAACADGPVSAEELLAALDRDGQLTRFLDEPGVTADGAVCRIEEWRTALAEQPAMRQSLR